MTRHISTSTLARTATVTTFRFLLALFALLLVGSSRVLAQPLPQITNHCDFCVASQGISPLEMGKSGIRFDVRYLRLSQSYRDGSRITNEENELESHLTNQLTLSYYVMPQLSLVAIVPYVSRYGSMSMEPGAPAMTLDNAGIGDIIAMARYKIFSASSATGGTEIIALNGALKLPTGNTTKRDATGELTDAHLQLGSGSTDVLLGSSFLVGSTGWGFAMNLTGVLTGKGANGHTFGNNLNYDATLRRRILASEDCDGPSCYLTAGVSGEWRGAEREDGELDPNSGGNVTYVAPGVQVVLSPAFTVEANFQQPVIHALRGEQLGETYRIMTGLQWQLQ